jgi:hypothetical protein
MGQIFIVFMLILVLLITYLLASKHIQVQFTWQIPSHHITSHYNVSQWRQTEHRAVTGN